MKAKLKQLISSLLVAALLLQMAPFEALAADSAATADPPVVSSEPDESNLLSAGGLEIHDTMTAPANSWKPLQASGTGRSAAVKNTASDSSALTRTGMAGCHKLRGKYIVTGGCKSRSM